MSKYEKSDRSKSVHGVGTLGQKLGNSWFALLSFGSIGMVILNKFCSTEYKDHFALLGLQNMMTVGLNVMGYKFGVFQLKQFSQKQWISFLVPTCLFVCMLVTSLHAMAIVPVSTVVISRCVSTCLISCIEVAFFNQSRTEKQIFALVVVVIGIVIYGYNDLSFDKDGYFWITCNTLAFVATQIVEKYTIVDMNQTAEGIAIIQNVEALPIVAFFSMFVSHEAPIEHFKTLHSSVIMAIICTGFLGFLLNLCYMNLSKFAQATSISLAGNLNKMICIALSAIIFKEKLSVAQVIGVSISMLGVALYSVDIFPQVLMRCKCNKKAKFEVDSSASTEHCGGAYSGKPGKVRKYSVIAFCATTFWICLQKYMYVDVSRPYTHAKNIFTRTCVHAREVKDGRMINLLPGPESAKSGFILMEGSQICSKNGEFVQGHSYFLGTSDLESHTQCIKAVYDVYTVCSILPGRPSTPRAVSLSPLLPAKEYIGWLEDGWNNAKMERSQEKYTVYIITYDRDELLKKVIKNYAQSALVQSIIISWNNLRRKPPDLNDFANGKELHVIHETTDSLNNRFRPHVDLIKTRAVFNVDDDILIPYPEVDFAFLAWLQFPNTLIGFSQYARSHSKHKTYSDCDKKIMGELDPIYYSLECIAGGGVKGYYGTGKFPGYSIMLDSAVFFDAKYLSMYWDEADIEMSQGRALVDETRNCEDFVLPILIASRSGEPPVMVNTYDVNERFTSVRHLQEKNRKGHHPGLNTMTGHYAKRNACLERLKHIFGGDALQHSIFKVNPLLPSDII